MKLPRMSPPTRTTGPRTTRASIVPAAPGGSWVKDQTNNDKTGLAEASSEVELTFTPNGECDCDSIAFVQAVRITDTKKGGTPLGLNAMFSNETPRRTTKRWNIDRVAGKKYGWYGRNDNGTFANTVTTGSYDTTTSTAVDATIYDEPTSYKSANEKWEFETCAICLTGTQQNRVYGCRTWGFTTDGAGKVSSGPSASASAPSVDWKTAVSMWNQQQAGGGTSRNRQSPSMVKLPTFTTS